MNECGSYNKTIQRMNKLKIYNPKDIIGYLSNEIEMYRDKIKELEYERTCINEEIKKIRSEKEKNTVPKSKMEEMIKAMPYHMQKRIYSIDINCEGAVQVFLNYDKLSEDTAAGIPPSSSDSP